MALRSDTSKTIAAALVLHALFTISIPWLILWWSADTRWAVVPIGPLRWVGAALVGFGINLYLWSLGRLIARQTAALPGQMPIHLQTSGWYARMRNPLLLGVVSILLGEAVFFASLPLLGYACIYWLQLHWFVVAREERDLRRAFGDAFDAYAREVPRWIPRWR
jgi:protein-S-isoprenylcysteine O-methyltransferase Ste14